MYKCMSVLYECQVCHVNLKVHGRIWVLCTCQLIQFSVENLPLSILFLDVNCTLPPFWEKAGLSNSNSGIVNDAASDLTTCLFKSCKMDSFL